MSAFVLAFSRSGATLQRAVLERAARLLVPADAHEVWQGAKISAARARFCVTPEDRDDELTRAVQREDLFCVADARLDNRSDLLRRLAARGVHAGASDTDIILAGYETWGHDVASHLRGDFAFVVWNGGEQSLYCASDPLWGRHIRFAHTPDGVVVGTRTRAVAECLPVRPAPNERLLRRFLAGDTEPWIEETSFTGVRRLPAGYYMSVAVDSIQMVRYCRIGEAGRESFKRDEDYADRFRELLYRSVRARLRSRSPVGLSLSGGLDSSSISMIAVDLVRRGDVSTQLRGYCSVYPQTPSADERSYQDTVISASEGRIAPRFIPAEDCWALKDVGPDSSYHLDELDSIGMRSLIVKRAQAASDDDTRVMLGGEWGDQLIGTPYGRSASLTDVPLWKWPGELPHFWRSGGLRPRGVVRALARKALPLPRKFSSDRGALHAPPLPTDRAYSAYWNFLGGVQVSRHIGIQNLAATTRLDWRSPFRDRELLEFVLHLPVRVLFGAGRSKVILREALRGVLPEPVRNRLWPAVFSSLWHTAAVREEARLRHLLLHGRVVDAGWLSRFEIERRLGEWQQGTGPYASLDRISRWVLAEEWLERIVEIDPLRDTICSS